MLQLQFFEILLPRSLFLSLGQCEIENLLKGDGVPEQQIHIGAVITFFRPETVSGISEID